MDKISVLPDEALVKILSFLPTKTAISTSILSKRWECVWLGLPKLDFYCSQHLHSLLERSLTLRKVPVLESLSFKLCSGHVKPEEFKLWIVLAVSRGLRELSISDSTNPSLIFPCSFFTSKSLVSLKLYGSGTLFEVVPRNVCLASLKSLHLQGVTYASEESFKRLLSICNVLEDLYIGLGGLWVFGTNYNKMMKKFAVIVPSLLRLKLHIPYKSDDVAGFVINTPSLEYFELEDKCFKRNYYVIENMPKLVEAYVEVVFSDVKSLLGSMKSVKSLTLCHCEGSHHTKVDYGDGFVFDQLEHLKLCVCSWHKSKLLNTLLKDSPNLQSLELFRTNSHTYGWINCWDEPTMVPECVLSNLQFFNCSSYSGSQAERDIAVYILKNARSLKTAKFTSEEDEVPKLEMLKELAFTTRASTCQLIFD